ncbi:MAG: hypothetical protein NTV09_08565 [Bacteroidetes bacterium]|nr:hypothetical protein [Bacteroidota bacterium]
MKTIYYTSFALLFALAIITTGCKKEKEEDYDTQSSQDNAQSENIFNEINEIADQAVEDGQLSTHRFGSGESGLLTSCAMITVNIDTTDGSGTAIIDFGSHFCQGNDAKFRKGQINVSFTGAYRNAGTVITMNAINYFVGYDSSYATKVNGQRVVTNNGLNSSGNPNFSIQANATLVNYLSQQMTWNSTRNREWIAGDSTTSWVDDEYLITGSANGKSFAGVNFSALVTQALHVKLSCRWITEGKFTLTPEGKPERYLDYGNGTCDGDATVTIGDKTYQVTLR